MADNRTPSALFKRAEQLRRWRDSDTNRQSPVPRVPARIHFSPGIVFLAACTAGDKDEVQRLLELGSDINTANVDGLTALHQACIDNNLDMVEFLIDNGADVNRRDNEGWTPLHATSSCGFLSIARYLLDNGADITAVNHDRELAIDIAENEAMSNLLKKVIAERGIDCEKARNAERDLLLTDAEHWATFGYEPEIVDLKTGGSPLHVAVSKGYTDVVQTLLEDCNLDPNYVDNDGWTPLHAAALWGHKESVALLLKYGADPHVKNYAGQTCLDLADRSMSPWLADAILKTPRRVINNNNNKRKLSPPHHDVKRVDIEVAEQTEPVANDRPAPPAEVPEIKTPKDKTPSPVPNKREQMIVKREPMGDELPVWRRSSSFRSKDLDSSNENFSPNKMSEADILLRRTHSCENDRAFYKRYRAVTARIKASSCSSIPPLPQSSLASVEPLEKAQQTNISTEANGAIPKRPSTTDRRTKYYTWNQSTASQESPTNANTQTTVRSSESVGTNSTNSTPSSTTPTKLSPGNIFKNFFKSFVPPVRDEESETQRKAHAKRVRETRRSTQGVTLEELKSAEQLVKKKTSNDKDPQPSTTHQKEDSAITDNGYDVFELEDAATPRAPALAATPSPTGSPAATPPPAGGSAVASTSAGSSAVPSTSARVPASVPAAEATFTLRRPPTGSTANTTSVPTAEDNRTDLEESEKESSVENRPLTNATPASTQAALNVIQRRRRPKRRSTGVARVDLEDMVNDSGTGGDGDCASENFQSGSERTEDGEELDYKALYKASMEEVKRLRALLSTSDQQLREAQATINNLTQQNQTSLSEIEKREKRAMERKLSEMEEELKLLQKLKGENERLKAENRALTRVVSKLTNSAAK